MRLAEIPQPPGRRGKDADQARSRPEAVVLFPRFLRDSGNGGVHLRRTAQRQVHHDRRQDQRKEHQRSLHGIRPAHRQKAADEGIGNGRARPQPHGSRVIQAGGKALKQPRARHDTRRTIDGEEKQDDDGGANLHKLPLRTETMVEIIGQGQRIIVVLGMHAQPSRDDQPVQPGADHQANGDPGFAQPAGVNRPRQAHQQPAGHIGRPGGHSRDESPQPPPAEDVVVEIAGRKIGRHANEQNGGKINAKSNVDRVHEIIFAVFSGFPCSCEF